MAALDPIYDKTTLDKLCAEYLRKSLVMKEICDARHDESVRSTKRRSRWTIGVSITVLSLTFFGTTDLANLINISESFLTIVLSITSLLLVLVAIWQITASNDNAGYENYRAIQDFASLSNKLRYLIGASSFTKASASFWASWIVETYDAAARNVPQITDAEFINAKSRINR